ncbi:MAG TPA: O-antigen ligase family protein [Opitutaceae bacterium]
MTSDWKTRLAYIATAVAAVLIGYLITDEQWILLALALVALGGSALAAWAPRGLPLAIFAVLIYGYILGNRGFAQLSPARSVPLFPAELALAAGGVLLLMRATAEKRLPFFTDRMNFALLVWIGLACARIGFDVHKFGLEAIRDFAMVYYAGFFFLAQYVFSKEAEPNRWLHHTLLIATALLLPMYLLFDRFPDFFTSRLTFRDVPLIFYKGDLVGTNLTIGGLVWFIYYEQNRNRWWALVLSLALVVAMLTTNNRSSALALLVGAGWLAIGGRWRLLRTLAVGGVLGGAALFFWYAFQGRPLSQTPLQSLYEEASSLIDPTGKRTYAGEGSFAKGDNNRFRVVWWETVIHDTWAHNPYIGLGFGYDLAEEFLKVYYPDSSDDFRARSPHSILVTTFARMGIVGLISFLMFLATLFAPTRWAMRGELVEAVPWVTVWAILTSSCFGVVLEGPMGAVLFWTALGIGSAARSRTDMQASEQALPIDKPKNADHRTFSPF